MKSIYSFLLVAFSFVASVAAQEKKSVLIFSKTTGFRHQSIPKGVATVSKLLTKQGINFKHSEDAIHFHADSLKKYDAIIFLNTTGDILDDSQKKNFQRFIQSGKGYVGIHAASDTEYNWPWYGALVGGYFASHPEVQEARIDVLNRTHPATAHLQNTWVHRDEWYDFKDIKDGLNILMTLDETTYKGGKMGKFHPIAWFQEFDGGRSFYTGLGHTDESYDSELFQKHILGGVKYALKIK
ncbi:MAG: ThuA domain-containing protein [Sphingobacterium composti]|uniref:ThuA domain-containing protein n=1 Tax=Sphingobacterium composti TaxID=363260 RepID=UPI00135BE5E8|nr:ThuA domain-containing protein [Sphingobacterium composti Ten et al. 2007 non Yoo et al. 2007]